MVSRKERERLQRKQDIVDVAEKLFLQKGFANVTMEQIAKESEFSRKTLYLYFKNREDLFTLVYLKVSRLRWEILSNAMDSKEAGYDKLKAYGEAYYDFVVRYPEYFRMGMYLDHNGMNYEKISSEISKEFNTEKKLALFKLGASYRVGIKDDTLINIIDVDTNIKHFIFSLRTMLNEIVLGYENKEFYYSFLELFLNAIKK